MFRRRPLALAAGFALIVLAGLAPCSAIAQCPPVFQGLGSLDPDGFGPCIAYAVSADGSTVVGMSNSTTGFQAFRWTPVGGLIGLGAFNPGTGNLPSSQARAVSANGSVIVGSSSLPNSLNEDGSPFRWTAATGLVFLGSLGGTDGGVARGVSADGAVVVGYGSDSNFGLEAFRWTQATGPVPLGDLTGGPVSSQAAAVSGDGSRVVGLASASFVYDRGFNWTAAAGLTAFANSFKPAGLSQDGRVVVGIQGGRATAITPTGPIMIPHLGMAGSTDTANACTADGSTIVGIMQLNQGLELFGDAFIWDAHNGTRFIRDMLINDFGADLTGWELNAATGISTDGRVICGYGFAPSGEQLGWVVHLPPRVDADGNGQIEPADVAAFIAAWFASLTNGTLDGDFDGNGIVQPADVAAFVTAWFGVLANGC